eukprot:g15434.t1
MTLVLKLIIFMAQAHRVLSDFGLSMYRMDKELPFNRRWCSSHAQAALRDPEIVAAAFINKKPERDRSLADNSFSDEEIIRRVCRKLKVESARSAASSYRVDEENRRQQLFRMGTRAEGAAVSITDPRHWTNRMRAAVRSLVGDEAKRWQRRAHEPHDHELGTAAAVPPRGAPAEEQKVTDADRRSTRGEQSLNFTVMRSVAGLLRKPVDAHEPEQEEEEELPRQNSKVFYSAVNDLFDADVAAEAEKENTTQLPIDRRSTSSAPAYFADQHGGLSPLSTPVHPSETGTTAAPKPMLVDEDGGWTGDQGEDSWWGSNAPVVPAVVGRMDRCTHHGNVEPGVAADGMLEAEPDSRWLLDDFVDAAAEQERLRQLFRIILILKTGAVSPTTACPHDSGDEDEPRSYFQPGDDQPLRFHWDWCMCQASAALRETRVVAYFARHWETAFLNGSTPGPQVDRYNRAFLSKRAPSLYYNYDEDDRSFDVIQQTRVLAQRICRKLEQGETAGEKFSMGTVGEGRRLRIISDEHWTSRMRKAIYEMVGAEMKQLARRASGGAGAGETETGTPGLAGGLGSPTYSYAPYTGSLPPRLRELGDGAGGKIGPVVGGKCASTGGGKMGSWPRGTVRGSGPNAWATSAGARRLHARRGRFGDRQIPRSGADQGTTSATAWLFTPPAPLAKIQEAPASTHRHDFLKRRHFPSSAEDDSISVSGSEVTSPLLSSEAASSDVDVPMEDAVDTPPTPIRPTSTIKPGAETAEMQPTLYRSPWVEDAGGDLHTSSAFLQIMPGGEELREQVKLNGDESRDEKGMKSSQQGAGAASYVFAEPEPEPADAARGRQLQLLAGRLLGDSSESKPPMKPSLSRASSCFSFELVGGGGTSSAAGGRTSRAETTRAEGAESDQDGCSVRSVSVSPYDFGDWSTVLDRVHMIGTPPLTAADVDEMLEVESTNEAGETDTETEPEDNRSEGGESSAFEMLASQMAASIHTPSPTAADHVDTKSEGGEIEDLVEVDTKSEGGESSAFEMLVPQTVAAINAPSRTAAQFDETRSEGGESSAFEMVVP